MNEDIKENLKDLKKAIKDKDKVKEYILRDILTHDCGLTYTEIEKYIK